MIITLRRSKFYAKSALIKAHLRSTRLLGNPAKGVFTVCSSNIKHYRTIGRGPWYKCTYIYAHLSILLCFVSLRDPPTPRSTKVYMILLCFGPKIDPPPLKWYFCTKKLAKSLIFFQNFLEKFKKFF